MLYPAVLTIILFILQKLSSSECELWADALTSQLCVIIGKYQIKGNRFSIYGSLYLALCTEK